MIADLHQTHGMAALKPSAPKADPTGQAGLAMDAYACNVMDLAAPGQLILLCPWRRSFRKDQPAQRSSG